MSNENEITIYADFNGIEECSFDPNVLGLNLNGYGTLASLSFHRIKLKNGQILCFGDFEGLKVIGEVYFDKEMISNRCSGWFAKFLEGDLIATGSEEYDFDTHTCFNCRNNLKSHLDIVGRSFSFSEVCPIRQTPVMSPLLPP